MGWGQPNHRVYFKTTNEMRKTSLNTVVLVGAFLSTILFYNKPFGLNLFLFELLVIAYFFVSRRIKRTSSLSLLTTGLLTTSALFTVVTYSTFAYIMNFVCLSLFIGIHLYPEAQSIVTALGLSFSNFFKSQKLFLNTVFKATDKEKGLGKHLVALRIFLLPIVIIIVFVVMYKQTNPIFDNLINKIHLAVGNTLSLFYDNLNFDLIFTFLVSVFFCNFLFQQWINESIISFDKKASDNYFRVKNSNKKSFNLIGLKNEYKSAIFLFFALNSILLLLNALDIYFVWFNFEWANTTLKAFVHEGTRYLLLSIFLSIGLVLYFFRGNLNFYSKNRLLKTLCYCWIVQNAVLTLSVIIRNYWYVHYFSLAHLRIGLFIFLAITLIGLITIYIKVKENKSAFYLFRVNTLVIIIILTVSSFFDWDKIIANYNVSQAGKSYYHLDYMSTLSYKTLPIVILPDEKLTNIVQYQSQDYSFERDACSTENYLERLENRKMKFKYDWENKGLLSWNLPEHLAYRKLFVKPTY